MQRRGTGGTIRGIGEVLNRQNPSIKIWAVEPEKSAIMRGRSVGTHFPVGSGSGLSPENPQHTT